MTSRLMVQGTGKQPIRTEDLQALYTSKNARANFLKLQPYTVLQMVLFGPEKGVSYLTAYLGSLL